MEQYTKIYKIEYLQKKKKSIRYRNSLCEMLPRKSTSEQKVLFPKPELLFQRGRRMAQDGFR